MDQYVEQKLRELIARSKNRMDEVKKDNNSDGFKKGFETGSTMILYELDEFVDTYLD